MARTQGPPTPVKARAPDVAEQALDLVSRARHLMRLFDLDGYEQAVPLLREAIELSPSCAAAYAALAETYSYWGFRREIAGLESQSLYDMAFQFADMALRLAPERADCHRAMAVALRRGERADPERRRQEAAVALDLSPDDPETLCEIWRVGGYSPDDPSLKRALELGEGLVSVHIDIGAVYAELGRHEEALAQLTAALRLNPSNSLASYDAAMVLDRMGASAKAVSLLRRALSLHPGDALLESGIELLGEKP